MAAITQIKSGKNLRPRGAFPNQGKPSGMFMKDKKPEPKQ